MNKIFKDDNGAAIEGYDVVAYFIDQKALIGNPEITYKVNDAEWYFKNEDHLKIFRESPEKYLPQFGGFCAYGISSDGKLYPSNPTAWKIVDEKLYLNYNKEYQQRWEKDIDENIKKAKSVWEKINVQANGSSTEKIKTAFLKNEKLLNEQPRRGQKTGKVKVTSSNGLACDIKSGNWKFKADMPESVGGTASAPTPGTYEAAALGSCLVIMIKIWSAKLDVPIKNIEIEVEFDSDSRVLYAVGNVPARWKAIRYNIKIESRSPEKEIHKVLDLAHQQSHVRGDLEFPFKIERKIKILTSE